MFYVRQTFREIIVLPELTLWFHGFETVKFFSHWWLIEIESANHIEKLNDVIDIPHTLYLINITFQWKNIKNRHQTKQKCSYLKACLSAWVLKR